MISPSIEQAGKIGDKWIFATIKRNALARRARSSVSAFGIDLIAHGRDLGLAFGIWR